MLSVSSIAFELVNARLLSNTSGWLRQLRSDWTRLCWQSSGICTFTACARRMRTCSEVADICRLLSSTTFEVARRAVAATLRLRWLDGTLKVWLGAPQLAR